MTQAVTALHPDQFIESVLELKPKLVVFDCDGTLWSGDAGAGFFYWEIERGYIPRRIADWALPRYSDYKAGRVDEETMCGEMVTIHAGMPERMLRDMAAEYFVREVEKRIFPEMHELTHRLGESGCELWAVSSTNSWVIAEGCKRFGIPEARVLSACVHMTDGCASDRLVRVPTGPGKAKVIREVIGRRPDAVFGNSVHDAAMLEIAKHPFAINPNPDLETMARERGWTVYKPRA